MAPHQNVLRGTEGVRYRCVPIIFHVNFLPSQVGLWGATEVYHLPLFATRFVGTSLQV